MTKTRRAEAILALVAGIALFFLAYHWHLAKWTPSRLRMVEVRNGFSREITLLVDDKRVMNRLKPGGLYQSSSQIYMGDRGLLE